LEQLSRITSPPSGIALSDRQTVVVAIPARNEAERIRSCLLALAGQTVAPDSVLVLANNCTDRTVLLSTVLAGSVPFPLHVVEHSFATRVANAGHARRLAMHHAAELAGKCGVLLTTDADSVAACDWVERNLLAIAAGADLVCGRVVVDPVEAALIPPHLHDDDALECELTALLDRLSTLLDPDPADPWPRHTEASGASLAVTVAAFKAVGGIPALPSGEDRAFVRTLARIDARIRHDPAVVVTVSGRIDGRAPGGMADAIRRRIRQQDEFTDANLEPSVDAYRRIDFRRRVGRAWPECLAQQPVPAGLATDLGIPAVQLRQMLDGQFFGTVWATIEAASPFLVHRRVRFADLPKQIAYARQLLNSHTAPTTVCP
jgi:hypothetical protein